MYGFTRFIKPILFLLSVMQFVLANDENCLTIMAFHQYYRADGPDYQSKWISSKAEIVAQLDCAEIDSNIKQNRTFEPQALFGNVIKGAESNDRLWIESYLSTRTKSYLNNDIEKNQKILNIPKQCFHFIVTDEAPNNYLQGHTWPEDTCSYIKFWREEEGLNSEKFYKETVLFFIRTQRFKDVDKLYLAEIFTRYAHDRLPKASVFTADDFKKAFNDPNAVRYPIE